MKFKTILLCWLSSASFMGYCQSDEVLDKLRRSDSIGSIKTRQISEKNLVTNEVHNVLFRNIYSSSSYNEEFEFEKEISRLRRFDNKKIDTIIFRQVQVFGENVYDTMSKGSKLERFLSTKLHADTRKKVIANRYLFLQSGQYFSPYQAYENARLIRSSGVFHDVRISPQIVEGDTNHLVITIYIQDAFPYSFDLGGSSSNFYLSLINSNIAGLVHRVAVTSRYNGFDTSQKFGQDLQYRIPNIFKKSFVDFYGAASNQSFYKGFEFGFLREFSRPEIRWAGGIIFQMADRKQEDLNQKTIASVGKFQQTWISRSFPFRSYNTTVNGLISSIQYTHKSFSTRPLVSSTSNFNFWNSNFILGSIGYSKIRFLQDRLLNGFGRTEDIRTGFSINALYGMDYNEFGLRNYYGLQSLNRFYNKNGSYFNIGARLGIFSRGTSTSQGVLDFNFQQTSRIVRFGKFRLRNFLNLRTTIGINHDSAQFISLNDQNGIRGANNSSFRGNHRYTASFMTNVFLPVTIAGFRFSVFSLLEIAKINYDFGGFLETPLRSGATLGIAVRNENLIFDAIQFQYGFYPSTSNLTQKGFLISSILPFRFQNLDISKPNIVSYE